MPSTFAALNVLLFLLPGFVSDRIIISLTPPRKRSDVGVIIDALVFAFVDYVIYRLLAARFALPAIPISLSDSHPESFMDGGVLGLVVLLAVSIAVGLLWAGVQNSAIIYVVLGRLRITRVSGRTDVWQDVFRAYKGSWFQVRLKDGTRITGWPKYYSDDGDKREIFLADALVEPVGHPDYVLEGPGVLLTERAEIERIEILPEQPKEVTDG